MHFWVLHITKLQPVTDLTLWWHTPLIGMTPIIHAGRVMGKSTQATHSLALPLALLPMAKRLRAHQSTDVADTVLHIKMCNLHLKQATSLLRVTCIQHNTYHVNALLLNIIICTFLRWEWLVLNGFNHAN